jgi:uncharacterized damage-inducible protein DinB
MTVTQETEIRYPVGRFDRTASITATQRTQLIESIADLPRRLREAVADLSDAQHDTPYRDGGWTVRQVVHHVPDSHINAYVRMKLALTEENPAIRTYEEKGWAELPDGRTPPIELSLRLLDALHERWVLLIRALSDSDFERTFEHPEWGTVNLTKLVQLYEWHGRHHAAHITSLRERNGW